MVELGPPRCGSGPNVLGHALRPRAQQALHPRSPRPCHKSRSRRSKRPTTSPTITRNARTDVHIPEPKTPPLAGSKTLQAGESGDSYGQGDQRELIKEPRALRISSRVADQNAARATWNCWGTNRMSRDGEKTPEFMPSPEKEEDWLPQFPDPSLAFEPRRRRSHSCASTGSSTIMEVHCTKSRSSQDMTPSMSEGSSCSPSSATSCLTRMSSTWTASRRHRMIQSSWKRTGQVGK